MKTLVVMILTIFLLAGCVITPPEKTDLLVRHQLEGEIVWQYRQGSTDQDPEFIVDYESLKEFCHWFVEEGKGE